MIIHQATLTDLNMLSEFDASYTTEFVWQMQAQETERSINVHFDTIRLPRAMKVTYPRSSDELIANWRLGECFLTAITEDAEEVLAYIDAVFIQWNHTLWINNLVVERSYRRQGIGTALLRAAIQWAREKKAKRIMLEMQTKNYPAICFAQKHQFVFCGYNDRYFPNGDIVLFFSLTV